jgi:hypothetical protein
MLSLNVRGKVLHQYITTCRIIVSNKKSPPHMRVAKGLRYINIALRAIFNFVPTAKISIIILMMMMMMMKMIN